MCCRVFFFNDTATTEIYTLSLHDALPISRRRWASTLALTPGRPARKSVKRLGPSSNSRTTRSAQRSPTRRSEEHTSELQSRQYLVCRLLLEKKKKKKSYIILRSLITYQLI